MTWSKLYLLILGCLCSIAVHGQKLSIQGTLLDSSELPLPFATVAVLKTSDSVMTGFSVSSDKGLFRIAIEDTGQYILKIIMVGYSPVTEVFRISVSKPTIDFGKIIMTSNQLLKDLDITAERIPVLMKGDTIEYNAAAFQTEPNAAVEDLLRQLPGVEIDENGDVKAQGEAVKKVYVDGNEFFGDDPKMATKNLPADAVKKVQVYDEKSKETEFTGVDDGTRNKTINIELKPDKKKGAFGTALAGYGSEDRFKAKVNLNKFNNKMQFTLIGMANNTNEDGFSWADYVSFMGGWEKTSGTYKYSALPVSTQLGQGLVTTYSSGFNFNYQVSQRLRIGTSYFLYKADKDLNRTVFQRNEIGVSSYNYNDTSVQHTSNWVHRLNTLMEYEIDSMNRLYAKVSVDFRDDDQYSSNTYASRDLFSDVSNAGNRMNAYEGTGLTTVGDLLYLHKFRKKGRSISFGLSSILTDNGYGGDLIINSITTQDSVDIADTTNQDISESTDLLSYTANAKYTEPIGRNKFLEISGEYTNDRDNYVYDVYDINETPRQYNTQLSTDFEKGYTSAFAAGSLRWVRDKINIRPGIKLRWVELQGNDLLREYSVSRSYYNPLPFIDIDYYPRKSIRTGFEYTTDYIVPSIEQLQTRIDNSNPLNLSTGNPDLRPEYKHEVNLRFYSHSQFHGTHYFGSLSGRYIKDQIQSARTFDSLLVQITKPVNVDHNLYLSANFGHGRKLLKKFRVNFNGRVGYSNGIFLLNGAETNTNDRSASASFFLYANKSKVITFWTSVSGTMSYRTYENTDLADQTTRSLHLSTNMTLRPGKKWKWTGSYDHNFYVTNATSGVTAIPLLKSSLSRYILKNDRGELSFEVFDILNRNRSVTQNIQLNYFEETRTNSIGRYFMLSFTYQLSKFKQPNAHDFFIID